MFGTACTPERPIGTCMVSPRGRLRRLLQLRALRPRAGGRVSAATAVVGPRAARSSGSSRPRARKRPKFRDARITMAHGAGGKATQTLIEGLLVPAFGSPALERAGRRRRGRVDGADLALTTDSFVVKPIRFPGGSIGELAVNGTVNDLAVAGARPLALTLSLILEEGLAGGRCCAPRSRRSPRAARGGRRRDRRRRHQGRRARPRRRDVHLHDRHRAASTRARALSPARAAPGRPRSSCPGSIGEHGTAIMLARGEFELDADDRVRHALAVAGGRRAAGRRRRRACAACATRPAAASPRCSTSWRAPRASR